MVPLYWIWTSTTTSIIKDFFVSENQYIGKLTILTTFFYYLCNASDHLYIKIRLAVQLNNPIMGYPDHDSYMSFYALHNGFYRYFIYFIPLIFIIYFYVVY